MTDTALADAPAFPTATGPSGALAGAAGGALALGIGELIAGASESIPSPVTAVGEQVVRLTPGDLVAFSISTFGPAQKPLLLIGVALLTLLVASGLGQRYSAGRRSIAVAGFAALSLVAGISMAGSALVSVAGSWLVAALIGLIAIATLAVIIAAGRSEQLPPVGHDLGPTAAGADRNLEAAASRRTALRLGGGALVVGAISALLGRRLGVRSTAEADRAALELPGTRSAVGATPTTAASSTGTVEAAAGNLDGISGISPLITPNEDFYRIDTALRTPQVSVDGWQLRIDGMVDNPLELTLDDLLAMDSITEPVTISCVSNEVGGDLVGNAVWQGVPLAELLAQAGTRPDAEQVVGRSVDNWTAGFPIEVATDGRPAMVAYAMNGEPLPIEHGFPARLIVPGLYGYVSATKWLASIELTRWNDFDGFWIPRGWAKEGPVKTQSRIDVPRSGEQVPAGTVTIAGVAWAPHRGIDRVEISVDGGPWQDAELGTRMSDDTWVQWQAQWDGEPGEHIVAVRATDGTGTTQTDIPAPPRPDGAAGYHTRRFRLL